MQLSELKPWDRNPRTITDEEAAGLRSSLEAFGDLSGLVYNARLQALVGGHQRQQQLMQVIGDKQVRELTEPDENGDRFGYILGDDGQRWHVRIVDWDEDKHAAANVAANNPAISGSFDKQLGDLLAEMKSSDEDLFSRLRMDTLGTLEGVPQHVPDFQPVGIDEQGRLDQKAPTVCPECGHEWQS